MSSAAVVVVGDLARSPRIVNHARELAHRGVRVSLIGIRDRNFTPPEGVDIIPLLGWRTIGGWGLPGAGIRMCATLAQLTWLLVRLKPDSILVQTPPAFPVLTAAWIAAKLTGARFLVDWHNYGFAMLALRAGPRLVRKAERYEARMAVRADAHFCVSAAMQLDIKRRFHVDALVVRDRPLQILVSAPAKSGFVAVCPSGWTADEDMAMLVSALETMSPCDGFEIHLTGAGPTRRDLMPRIEALRARGDAVHTGFLPEADYRTLLTRANLGISMHRSASGLDLAMKVVDLFSAAVPVCAFDYGGSLPEQVIPDETGFLFRNVHELAALLTRLQYSQHLLADMSAKIRALWTTTWREEWDIEASHKFFPD